MRSGGPPEANGYRCGQFPRQLISFVHGGGSVAGTWRRRSVHLHGSRAAHIRCRLRCHCLGRCVACRLGGGGGTALAGPRVGRAPRIRLASSFPGSFLLHGWLQHSILSPSARRWHRLCLRLRVRRRSCCHHPLLALGLGR